MGPTVRVRGRKGALLTEACGAGRARAHGALGIRGFVTAAAQFFSTQCSPGTVPRLNLGRLSPVNHEVPSGQPLDMDMRRSSFLRLNYTESHAPAPTGPQPAAPRSSLSPPPLSLLCADDKLATPRNDENLLQRALQKMLSGMKERKKILLHEIHIRAGATNNSGR